MKPVAKGSKARLSGSIKTKRLAGRGHCLRMLAVLSDYLDRKARKCICQQVERHLKECPDCRLYLDTMRKTVVLYRSLGDEKVPPDVTQRLFRTIRLEETRSRKATEPGPKNHALRGCFHSRRRTDNKRLKKTAS